MSDVEIIAEALRCGAPGCDCHKPATKGEFCVHCPAHDDEHPSLSVAAKGGKVLVKCRAGCSQAEVIARLRERGLWTTGSRDGYRPGPSVVATFDYRDASGNFLYRVERVEPGKGGRKKDFRLKHPAPDGSGWHWGLGGKPEKCSCPKIGPTLYRLPELLSSGSDERIFIPEGEGKVDRLRSLGLLATCNSGGGQASGRKIALP